MNRVVIDWRISMEDGRPGWVSHTSFEWMKRLRRWTDGWTDGEWVSKWSLACRTTHYRSFSETWRLRRREDMWRDVSLDCLCSSSRCEISHEASRCCCCCCCWLIGRLVIADNGQRQLHSDCLTVISTALSRWQGGERFNYGWQSESANWRSHASSLSRHSQSNRNRNDVFYVRPTRYSNVRNNLATTVIAAGL